MIYKRAVGIIALFLCFQTLEAQSFATRQLAYLSDLMKCALPQQSGTFYCQKISTLPLLVEYDNAGEVCHLGVAIFSKELKEAVGKPVCDFQERLFLEVFLQGNETKARNLLNEYKVECPDGNFGYSSFFRFLENALLFASKEANDYVLTKDSLTWKSTWANAARAFSLRFPANFDLILGMDKKEAEIWLATQLQNYSCEPFAISPPLVETGALEQLNRSVYVMRGTNQFVQSMNSNLYFYPDAANCRFQLLYDSRFMEESICNLFNHPDVQAEGLDLQVRQQVYGGTSQSYKMKLSDFQHFMRDDFEIFTGIEKCTPDAIEFTVMYKSKWYNCFHLLHVQTTPQQLFDKTDALKANLSAFIPNHNITNLYNDETINPYLLALAPAAPLMFKFACDTSRMVALVPPEYHIDTFQKRPINQPYYDAKLFVKGLKMAKWGNIGTIVGGACTVGGFVGMLCTSNKSMHRVFSGFMYGGFVPLLVGNIAIGCGNRKMNSAKSSLSFGITQSGGAGLVLKY